MYPVPLLIAICAFIPDTLNVTKVPAFRLVKSASVPSLVYRPTDRRVVPVELTQVVIKYIPAPGSV